MKSLLDGYTYGWPPEEEWSYSAAGSTVIVPSPPLQPIAPSVTPSTLPGCAKQYVARNGDFCFRIAEGTGLELETLEALNPTLNCSTLQPGSVVCVAKAASPPPRPSPRPPPPAAPVPKPPSPAAQPVLATPVPQPR